MRTYIKAGIMTLIAVFLAFAFKTVGTGALGMDAETNALDRYSDMMLEARGLFLEQNEDFLELAMAMHGMDGLRLRRCADGTAIAWLDGGFVPVEEAFSELGADRARLMAETADRLFAGSDVSVQSSGGDELVSGHAQVINVCAADGEVLFFTHYHELGCVGVAYSPGGSTGGYDSIELVEEWRIFYLMTE